MLGCYLPFPNPKAKVQTFKKNLFLVGGGSALPDERGHILLRRRDCKGNV